MISLVVREWGRRALSTSCKLQLKKWGKGEDRMSKEIGDDEIDISMALSDQNELIRSYEYSRKDRVLRRDGLNRRHPVIPLKEIRDENGKIIGPSVPCNALNDEDSSDEERRIEEIKLKKNKAVFANCYICQINFIPEFFPETTVKGENINFIRAGGCLYIRRFLNCIDSFIHCPEEIKPLIEYSGVSLDSLPIWAILAISKYLPSAELRTLREILITHMRENSMATIKWSKHLGHWIEDGILKQDIQDKFMERLKPVSSWWSTHQFNLGEEFVLP
uniref:Uncharacterized protein n=1 Tax=Heterorhabditis bacteriophora TaxID=37862 RepID=A0A1I7X450_HETBA